MRALIDARGKRPPYSLNSKWVQVQLPRVGETNNQGLEIIIKDWSTP